MNSTISLPKKDYVLILFLAIVYLLIRVPFLEYLPLVQDESIYSLIISEMADSPGLTPTFFGEPVSWKPPLFHIVYSLFSKLPLSIELVSRLPSLLFGLFSLVPLFYLLQNAGCSRNIAFFSTLIFLFSFVSNYPQTALLADSLAFLLIITSLFFYTEKKYGNWKFLIAGILVFAVFFVKSVLAFMIPLLAVVFYLNQKDILKNPIFLISLIAAPLALVLHFMLLDSVGLAEEFYFSEMKAHLSAKGGILEGAYQVASSISTLLIGAGFWLALSFVGFWKNWRENKFMTVWYLFTAVAILGGQFMPWYFLPVFPAIAYFSSLTLIKHDGKERIDTFFAIFLALTIIATIIPPLMWYDHLYSYKYPEKEVGLLLSGKENVMILGNYRPGIIAYKVLTEKRNRQTIDFGWILDPGDELSDEIVLEYVDDYYLDKYEVIDGSFSSMFTNHVIYRKDTDISDFDYIVLVNHGIVLDGDLIYNNSGISVYHNS
ncbi:glycosyltransferase family 39 protein [Candidatus Micrarchaeota archaeon]|nr:glycosyltransferase family 39 protein [Candidatus Micrarchaeota archaeon]MBU1681475.1 glycosyltransferase family 39 protein [Candidatus Micrarchaeota archaeon]